MKTENEIFNTFEEAQKRQKELFSLGIKSKIKSQKSTGKFIIKIKE
jgi:hypothetical protein